MDDIDINDMETNSTDSIGLTNNVDNVNVEPIISMDDVPSSSSIVTNKKNKRSSTSKP